MLYGDYLGTKGYKEADKIVENLKSKGKLWLLEGFKKAVDNGDIQVLIGIDKYIDTAEEVKEYGTHIIDRIIGQHAYDDISKKGWRRGVKLEDAKDALLNPKKINSRAVKGESRNQYKTENTKVTVEVKSGKLIQTSQGDKR